MALTRCSALEAADYGIRINAVCPGMVHTPMAVAVTNNYDPEIVNAMVALLGAEMNGVVRLYRKGELSRP